MNRSFTSIFYTDGGGDRSDGAAAAAIIEDTATSVRHKIVAYLGGATNNEAEIFGGLLAFSFLKRHDRDGEIVRWICDSEYTLKSATGYIHAWQRNGWRTAQKSPVKNQGLWKSYLWLSQNMQISPEHVRGHSGHPENEECDQVCTLVRRLGMEAVAATEDLLAGWEVIDGREVLEGLRVDDPSEDLFEGLVSLIPSGSEGRPAPVKDELRELRKKLSELVVILEKLEGHSEPLVQHLLQVIRSRGPI